MRIRPLLLTASVVISSCISLSFSSCSSLKLSAKALREKAKSSQEADAEQVKNDTPGSLSGLQGVQPKFTSPSQLYDEEDIVWADEDPEASMGELEVLWAAGPQDEWFQSYAEAMKEARKEGKPVLLWFTDSQSKMTTKALSDELFSTVSFSAWAAENVVRLRVDSAVHDEDDARLKRKRDYVNSLKKRFKVMGAPVVLMLSPRGSVFGKYSGYKTGSSSFYFGRLKTAYRNAIVDYGKWREDLERKGYRVWHDHRGRKVFAKPTSLKGDVLYLVMPDGDRSKTSLNKLSAEDRDWVLKQKQVKR